ncbi:MAG: DUF4157 domain-containing protein [Bacteroidia bacterium]
MTTYHTPARSFSQTTKSDWAVNDYPAEGSISIQHIVAGNPIQRIVHYTHIANGGSLNPIQLKASPQGSLPNTLKSGIESLSGIAMDDVRVHYNSSKPAQLQAHAYAQGTDIHIAPGQERHLPHEAWHVVQQKQGRVKPTLQLKGVAINDDSALEREADVMGVRAMGWQSINSQGGNSRRMLSQLSNGSPVQRAILEVPSADHTDMKSLHEESQDLKRGMSSIQNRPDAGQIETKSLAQVPNEESIYFVGHGSPGQIGSFDAEGLLTGLKEMNLRKDYTGTIIIAACDSGVRTNFGLGPSLAGELAGKLNKEGYKAKVIGLTGRMVVLDNGEIRIVKDSPAYDKALEPWRVKNKTYMAKQLEFDTKGAESKIDGQVLATERTQLAAERDAIIRANSVDYEVDGKILLGKSDDNYLLAGGIVLAIAVVVLAKIIQNMSS